MKRILFIANFLSGKETIKLRLTDILTRLTSQNCLVTVYPITSTYQADPESVIKEAQGKYDCILCGGGDGSLNHMINYVMRNHVNIPIAYLPAGSTNDFARSLNNGAELSFEDFCDTAAGNKEFSYDIGKFNDVYFNYIAAFGAFTNVSYDTSQNLKNIFGYSAYILNMIRNIPDGLSTHIHMQIKHDEYIEDGEYIFGGVCNTLSVGGVATPLLKRAQLDDGKFEVVLIKAPKDLIDLNNILSAISSGSTDNPYISVFSSSHISFHSEKDAVWTLDGEEGGSSKDTDIQVVPRSIRMLVK